MVKEHIEFSSPWTIDWQAALTPDSMMVPAEDIFLVDAPVQASVVHRISLTATIGTIPGLLFHSSEELLCGIPCAQPESTKKAARNYPTKSHKKSQRRAITNNIYR
jgi:hypothetical protein